MSFEGERTEGKIEEKLKEMGKTRNKGKYSRVELLWSSEHEMAVTGFVIDDCNEVRERRVHVHKRRGSTPRELGRGRSV